MNIHSDVVFANQCDNTCFSILNFENHTAKMISTNTRGVGINRNFSLMYASADICLFADDDVIYMDDVEDKVTREFDRHPDADVFIFNFEHSGERRLNHFFKTHKCSKLLGRMGAGFQIAFRLASAKKKNIWFTTLFGGGCLFPCGEDSKWLVDAYKNGLNIYVSKEIIGSVSFETSSWFSGVNERYFYGFGAYYKDAHPKTFLIWVLYFALRTTKMTKMGFLERIRWMRNGIKGYDQLQSYEEFIK
jgi:glycosyltransferase involved in cell wall biosynthesis